MKIRQKFIRSRFLQKGIALLLLQLSALPALSISAGDNDPCASFEDAEIDQTLIATMLNAAKNGHLYQIKDGSSKMGFCVDSPIGMVKGSFQNFKGGIALKEPANQTLVSVNVNSLQTNVPFTENLLKSEQFFNASDFPQLMFISSEFQWLSETRAVLKGNLSMHGITRAVAFYVEITEIDNDLGDSDTILVKATTTVQRSQFDMATLSPAVSDKVNLCMSVEAERYKSL